MINCTDKYKFNTLQNGSVQERLLNALAIILSVGRALRSALTDRATRVGLATALAILLDGADWRRGHWDGASKQCRRCRLRHRSWLGCWGIARSIPDGGAGDGVGGGLHGVWAVDVEGDAWLGGAVGSGERDEDGRWWGYGA